MCTPKKKEEEKKKKNRYSSLGYNVCSLLRVIVLMQILLHIMLPIRIENGQKDSEFYIAMPFLLNIACISVDEKFK